MIDFSYDKIVVVKYSLGAGGKFLINCLSLNDDCVFQTDILAQYQLDNKFTVKNKLKYLNYFLTLSKKNQTWNDLQLHEKNFFGISDHDYFKMTEDDIKNYKYNNIVEQCIDNDKFIFLSIHSNFYLSKIIKCWENAKLISFTNENKFISFRNQNLISNNKELYYQNLTFTNENDTILDHNFLYKWDCDWYLSKEMTLLKVKNLYNILNINGFNEKVISWYYDKWMNVIR